VALKGRVEEYEAVKKTTMRQKKCESPAPSGEQLLRSSMTHTTNCSSLGINSPTQSIYNKAGLP